MLYISGYNHFTLVLNHLLFVAPVWKSAREIHGFFDVHSLWCQCLHACFTMGFKVHQIDETSLRLVYVADLHLPIWVRDPILAVALKWEVCFMDKYGFACFLQTSKSFATQKRSTSAGPKFSQFFTHTSISYIQYYIHMQSIDWFPCALNV